VKLAVLIAAGGAPWEAGLVAALDREGSGVRVTRRCVDVVDLLAVAASGQGQVALVSAGLRRLDADAIDRLRAGLVVPVAVVPRDSTADEDRMRALGIAHLVAEDAAPEVVIAVLVDAMSPNSPAGPAGATDRAFGDPAASMAIPPGAGPPLPAEDPARRGSVVAVWGPTGAPGRTTVAIALADELARLDSAALLVDADVFGGTVAAALGLLDESPGLAAACRQAGSARLDAPGLAALCWQLQPTLRVLTGIPLASRWPELRPAAVEATLSAARTLADFVVVDCGFCLETDEELSFDSLAPRRNGATLAVLDSADLVIIVGAADPIGMQRLVRALADLGEAGITGPTWIVLNRVRSGAVPGDPEAELRGALDLFAGRTPAAFVPWDQAGTDGALAVGQTLGEHCPGSPMRAALVELAAAVAGVAVPGGSRVQRRRRRRAAHRDPR
jgi:MinD-like ATPase involved in chromosome partitioning or flagellar assembly